MITKDGSRIDFSWEYKDWPLSLDLKITEYCTNECPFCHEASGPAGKHCNPEILLSKLSGLPHNTEVAIGGGNPLTHPQLQEIISGLNCIVNMTVRGKDVPGVQKINGITALGISVDPGDDLRGIISSLSGPLKETMVAHLILGITPIETYREVKKWFPRVLWLGFKNWGRNRGKPLPDLKAWDREISKDLYSGRGIIAFDNLGLEQLQIKNKLLRSEWETFYLGPEFSKSMYVDAVKGVWAPSSTSSKRISWRTISLKDYYAKNHITPER